MFSLPNSYSSLIIQHEAVAWSLVSTASPCKCSLTHQPLAVATRAASSHLTKPMVRASSHSSGPSAQLPLWLHKLSWANRIFVGTWQKKAASFIPPLGCGASLTSCPCPGLDLWCQRRHCQEIGELFHLGRLRRSDPGPVPGASSQATAEEPQAPAPQGTLKPVSAAPMIRLSGMELS